MSKNYERDLRDAEWELYLLYRNNKINRDIEERMWREIENLMKLVDEQ